MQSENRMLTQLAAIDYAEMEMRILAKQMDQIQRTGIEKSRVPGVLSLLDQRERDKWGSPDVYGRIRKYAKPSEWGGTGSWKCVCGRTISANKEYCAKCQPS